MNSFGKNDMAAECGAGSRNDEGGDGMEKATRQALLHKVDECQEKLDNLEEKAMKELSELKNKYSKLKKPLYKERTDVIDQIPNFWLLAIVNHPQISKIVGETEENCIQFLQKLEVEEFENVEEGFRIKLCFAENPFFQNTQLVKEFRLGPYTEPTSTTTIIKWKKQKKSQFVNSPFFSWFCDNENPATNEIATAIKDELWPNSLQYYGEPEDDKDTPKEVEIVDLTLDEKDADDVEAG